MSENVNLITNLITSVGFPIVCTIAMGWFIYKIYEKSLDRENEIYQKSLDRENELREEIKENQKVNGKFAEIISRYSVELGEIKKDVKEIKEDIIIIGEKV